MVSINALDSSGRFYSPKIETDNQEQQPRKVIESTSQTSSSTITISKKAQQFYQQSVALERQAAMSKDDLRQFHARTRNMLISFSNSVHALGSAGLSAKYLPETDDPARLQRAQQAIDFAVAAHNYPPKTAINPFAGLERSSLASIVYDDTGHYTEAERYAAHYAAQQIDENYFTRLIGNLAAGDGRSFYTGAIEHFDSLSPVEKAIYPDNYREALQGYLKEESMQRASFLDLLIDIPVNKRAEPKPTEGESIHDRLIQLFEFSKNE